MAPYFKTSMFRSSLTDPLTFYQFFIENEAEPMNCAGFSTITEQGVQDNACTPTSLTPLYLLQAEQ